MERTERGWAGHFCCSYKCQWHRNTLIEHEGKYLIVSSVGQMLENFKTMEYEEIGLNRYYETMVFVGKNEGPYIDCDTQKQRYFEGEWSVEEYPKEGTDLKAEENHENAVKYVMEHFDDVYNGEDVF